MATVSATSTCDGCCNCPGLDPDGPCLYVENIEIVVTDDGLGGTGASGPASGYSPTYSGGGAILVTNLGYDIGIPPESNALPFTRMFCDPDTGKWFLEISVNGGGGHITTLSHARQSAGFPLTWGPFSGPIVDGGGLTGTISFDAAALSTSPCPLASMRLRPDDPGPFTGLLMAGEYPDAGGQAA